MATLRTHALPLAIVFALCALAAVIKIHYFGFIQSGDYTSYIETAKQLAGLPIVEVHPERLLKPLAPLLVAALIPTLGAYNAFVFEVIFFYFAFAMALYVLGYAFFKDKCLAVLAVLLGALSYPILRYGLDLYTETGAQFFYVLSLCLTLFYMRTPSRRLLLANALIVAIGFLWKEYSIVAGISFGLVLLFESVALRRKVGNIALFAFVALLPSIVVQIPIYLTYHYTYLDWYLHGGASGFSTNYYTLRGIVKSTGALLGLAWLLVPFGIASILALHTIEKRFLLYILPATFVSLLWGCVSSRLFYVIAPPCILLALLGVRRFPAWVQYATVTLITVANAVFLVVLA